LGHFIALEGTIPLFSFNKFKNTFSPFLSAGFCPNNLAFARKIMALLESDGEGGL